MEKKILVAVDESENSLQAVHYVADGMDKTGSVTLLSVLPDPTAACGLDSPSLTPLFRDNKQAFCIIEGAKEENVKVFMENAKKLLTLAGFPSENIEIKIRKMKVGIARDILSEAQEGKYTTIVIGRRGLSGIKQFLLGSVSNKIIQLAKKIAVIVVD